MSSILSFPPELLLDIFDRFPLDHHSSTPDFEFGRLRNRELCSFVLVCSRWRPIAQELLEKAIWIKVPQDLEIGKVETLMAAGRTRFLAIAVAGGERVMSMSGEGQWAGVQHVWATAEGSEESKTPLNVYAQFSGE
jgi:hypothetical protein